VTTRHVATDSAVPSLSRKTSRRNGAIEIAAPAGTDWPPGLDRALGGHDLSQVEGLSVTLPDLAATHASAQSVPELARHLPALRSVNVRVLGPIPPATVASILALCQEVRRRGLEFQVDFVLGDEADAFAAFDAAEEPIALLLAACRTLRSAGAGVCWLVPARPALAFRMEGLFSLAREEGIDAILVPAGSFAFDHGLPDRPLTADERLFLWDFVSYRLLEEERSLLPPGRVELYETLRDALAKHGEPGFDDRQRVDVLVARAGNGTGWTVHTEKQLDLAAIGGSSASTISGAAGGASSSAARAGEVAEVLCEGTRALAQWAGAMAAKLFRRDTRLPQDKRLRSVMIIGAYGGEHIGDIAILGGVLFRVHRRYGTTRAIVMSQRPNHTRHLVSMLDTPVDLSVEISEQSRARDLMSQVDGVVYAGGPLMDLPKQLVRHLYAVSLARRAGKPFVAEGIGAGPFLLWPSEWTARRIVRMAERISVRTTDDAKVRLVSDLSPEVGRDPAFDYLETRGRPLTRIADADRRWVERLFEEIDGRLAIGVNLRPIRPVYTVGVPAAQRVERTRLAEAQFEQQLAEGMQRFTEAAARPPCFVFYPMNSIQFGECDLRSAYRVKRLLGSRVDFRIWQADASLDGVIALLRRLDAAISMRFHATIFALSQGCPTIGIDYRVGKRDKVAALLGDFGQSANCGRVDEVTSGWLCERLSSIVARDALRRGPGTAAASA
jgi:polysaccharide pyruvyl transferase WcaK-like protein